MVNKTIKNKYFFIKPMASNLQVSDSRGYSLVEVLIYSSILGLFFGVIVGSILSMAVSYKTLKISKNLNLSAISVMERLEFEIRRAEAVSLISLVPPKLVLNTYDELGNPLSMEFSTSTENAIILKQNGTSIGKLMIYDTKINNLTFTKLVQPGVSEAVKIDMTITNESGGKSKTETFHNTVILRGSYKT